MKNEVQDLKTQHPSGKFWKQAVQLASNATKTEAPRWLFWASVQKHVQWKGKTLKTAFKLALTSFQVYNQYQYAETSYH